MSSEFRNSSVSLLKHPLWRTSVGVLVLQDSPSRCQGSLLGIWLQDKKFLQILQLNHQPNDSGFTCTVTTFSRYACVCMQGFIYVVGGDGDGSQRSALGVLQRPVCLCLHSTGITSIIYLCSGKPARVLMLSTEPFRLSLPPQSHLFLFV